MPIQAMTEASKDVLRITPLGLDRNHHRYWVFPCEAGLYVEHGWFDAAPMPPTSRAGEGVTGDGGVGGAPGGGVGEFDVDADISSDSDEDFDARKKPKDRQRLLAPHAAWQYIKII